MPAIYITAEQVEIYVEPGKKSLNDFIVKYRKPSNRQIRFPLLCKFLPGLMSTDSSP